MASDRNQPTTKPMKNNRLIKTGVILAIACAALFGGGCGKALDQAACLESVMKAFPGAEVGMIPNEKYRFVVRDADGAIWYVKTMNLTNPYVSQKSKIFTPNDKVEHE